MLRSIRRSWRRASDRVKAAGGRMFAAVRGRLLGWNPIGRGKRMANEQAILELLGSNARLASPLDAIATDVSMVTWVLKKRGKAKDGTFQWDELGRVGAGTDYTGEAKHPLLERLANPHPRLSWSAWLYVLTVYRLGLGFAPIRLQDVSKGIPGSLLPIAPHCVPDRGPRADAEGKLFFWVTVDGTPEQVKYDDMLWPFRVDPMDPLGCGLGKARSVDDEVAADESMSKFNNYYFENGAVLGPVVNIPGADLDALEKEWKQERVGVINSHKPLLTNSDQAIQVANTAPTMRDLGMPEGRKLGRDFILQAFCVSAQRVGVLENSGRAAIEGSDFHQQSYCTLPELIYWREFFNQHLIKKVDPDLYLDFINPVKETAEAKRELADTGIRGGWMTINEAREMHGLKKLPGGEILLIPVNNVIMLDVSKGIVVPEISAQLRLSQAGNNGDNTPKPGRKRARPPKKQEDA